MICAPLSKSTIWLGFVYGLFNHINWSKYSPRTTHLKVKVGGIYFMAQKMEEKLRKFNTRKCKKNGKTLL